MSGDEAPNGGAAFPQLHDNWRVHNGMTLRDYFAAKAPLTISEAVMAADLEPGASSIEVAVCRVMLDPKKRAVAIAMLATLRAEYADAMLKARKA